MNTNFKVGDKIEKIIIPLHCNGIGKSLYARHNDLWHIHFDDMQQRHYCLLSNDTEFVRSIMKNVDKAIKATFVIADINEFEHSITIKDLKILEQ